MSDIVSNDRHSTTFISGTIAQLSRHGFPSDDIGRKGVPSGSNNPTVSTLFSPCWPSSSRSVSMIVTTNYRRTLLPLTPTIRFGRVRRIQCCRSSSHNLPILSRGGRALSLPVIVHAFQVHFSIPRARCTASDMHPRDSIVRRSFNSCSFTVRAGLIRNGIASLFIHLIAPIQ